MKLMYILFAAFAIAQSVTGAPVIYSTDFNNGNNEQWVAHGGNWKWAKAPVKDIEGGDKAIYVDGTVRQIYLIKQFTGLKITSPRQTVLKMKLKIDSAVPPAYISCSVKQGNIYVGMANGRILPNEWFEWEIPLMSMSGPRKERFNPDNGAVTSVSLFIIQRETAPDGNLQTLYLKKLSIEEVAATPSSEVTLNDWRAPSTPTIHPETLHPLLTDKAGESSFYLDKACTIAAPAAIAKLADELNAELAKTLGGKLKVVRREGKNPYFIYISRSDGKKTETVSDMQGEDFRLAVTEEGILLEAGTQAGLINGIYEFLHGLGYRWYMPGELGECLPPCMTFRLKKTDKHISPKWEMRYIWYAYGLWTKGYNTPAGMEDFELWSRRNHIKNTTDYPAYHNFYRIFPKDKYFKAHPEYFSLIKGKRKADAVEGQICASNTEVIRIVAESAAAAFKNTPSLKGYSLTPNDNPYMCQCENCLKYQDPSYLVDTRTYAYGYPEGAELHIQMMNRIRNLISSEFPDKYLITIVNYDNISRPPRQVVPDKHLVFGFTTMPCCKLHALTDGNCPVNSEFLKLYQSWEKFGNPMYIRDYDPIVYWKGLPALLTGPVYSNLKQCGSTPGFLGFNTEAHRSWATNVPNYYLKARLGWEREPPDLQKIMDEYFVLFFGPASVEMKNYYSLFACLLKKSPLHPVARDLDYAMLGLFTSRNCDIMADTLARAVQACPPGSKYAERIAMLKMNFDYLKLYVKMLQEINEGKTKDALDVIGQMKILVAELDRSYPSAILRKYVDGELEKTAAALKERQDSQAGKNVVADLNKCSFRTDPDKAGVKEQWFGVDYSSIDWKNISLTAPWEKQGYNYDGTAWYRKKFFLPLNFKGRELMLYVGALDEEGVFYLNGKKVFIRKHLTKDGWKESFEFPVSQYLNYGSENVLAVSVTDSGGDGGIWKGMFLYQK
ncbi:MAG: Glycosyl hydrolases family 2, sugar binding domain [Lentisphaerae bacterium ADurb.Bin242]|nr:MAG: Glycosyl hydrolases family 2, sugar binding domain [Lentisphaerae bacterium ADurb.Bin242]